MKTSKSRNFRKSFFFLPEISEFEGRLRKLVYELRVLVLLVRLSFLTEFEEKLFN